MGSGCDVLASRCGRGGALRPPATCRREPSSDWAEKATVAIGRLEVRGGSAFEAQVLSEQSPRRELTRERACLRLHTLGTLMNPSKDDDVHGRSDERLGSRHDRRTGQGGGLAETVSEQATKATDQGRRELRDQLDERTTQLGHQARSFRRPTSARARRQRRKAPTRRVSSGCVRCGGSA